MGPQQAPNSIPIHQVESAHKSTYAIQSGYRYSILVCTMQFSVNMQPIVDLPGMTLLCSLCLSNCRCVFALKRICLSYKIKVLLLLVSKSQLGLVPSYLTDFMHKPMSLTSACALLIT